MDMKNVALIFAGGVGQRMGGQIPKQFLEISGYPIIIHTLRKFQNHPEIDDIYIACVEAWIPYLQELIVNYNLTKTKRIFHGGESGQESIYFSLKEAKRDHENAIVLIHDGVRPVLTQETISKAILGVKKYGSAITSTASHETPLQSIDSEFISDMPSRNCFYTAQAPQCFYLNDILAIHEKERESSHPYEGIVDSCGLMYKYGVKCHIIEGNKGNIKVTTPSDFFSLVGILNAQDYQQMIDFD